MAKMWDVRGQKFITVPEDRVEELFRSGNYAFPRGSEVNVRLPNGDFDTISEGQAPLLFSKGGGYDTAQARQHRVEVEEYGDTVGTGVATGIGVTRGLLSEPVADWLIAKTTPLTEEDIAKYSRANPYATGVVGQTLGVGLGVGAALFTGGGSAAGQIGLRGVVGAGATATARQLTAKQIAKKALNLVPAVGAARLGLGAERVVGGLIGIEKAGTVVTKALGVGAAGAVGSGIESVAYATVDVIAEEVLGDPSRTAIEMLGEVGTFGAIGFGFGGVLGGVIGGGTTLLRGIRGTEKVLGAPVTVQAGKVMDRISAAIGKGDYTELRKLVDDPDYAWKVLNGDDVLEGAAKDSAQVFNDMAGTFDEVSSLTKGSKKGARMLKEVVAGNEWRALHEGYQSLQQFRAALKEQIKNPAGFDVGALRQLRESADFVLDNTRKHLENLWGVKLRVDPANTAAGWQVVTKKKALVTSGEQPLAGEVLTPSAFRDVHVYTPMELSPHVGPNPEWGDFSGHMFNKLDEFKKISDGQTFQTGGTKQGFNTYGLLSRETGSLRTLLENGDVWGAKAATMQREVNKAYSDLLRHWPEFQSQFGRKVGGKHQADMDKILTMLRKLKGKDAPPVRPGDPAGGSTMVDVDANQLRIDEMTGQMGGESAVINEPNEVASQAWDHFMETPSLSRELADDLTVLRQTNRPPSDFVEYSDSFAWGLNAEGRKQVGLLRMGDEITELTSANARGRASVDPDVITLEPAARDMVEDRIRQMKLGETFRAYEAYILATQRHYGIGKGTDTLRNMAALKSSYGDLAQTVNGMKALKKMGDSSGLGLTAAFLGTAVGGPVGIATGAVVAAILNPAKALRTRAALLGLKSKAVARRDLAINRAVSRIVKPSKRAIPGGIQYDNLGRVREPWLRKLHHLYRIEDEKRVKKREELRPVAAQARDTLKVISSLSENPERLNNILAKGLTSIDGAPQLQVAMIQKTMANLQYCNETLPVGMNRTTDVLTGEDKYLVTDAAAHEYMEKVCTVNDWLGVLGPSIEEGIATPTMVKTAEFVDPEGFGRYKIGIRDGVLAHYQATGERPSLASSGQLSILLGIPVSSGYAGPVLRLYQNLYSKKDKAQTQNARMNALKQRPKDTMTKLQSIRSGTA